MKRRVAHAYKTAQYLSLDVVAGGLCSGAMAARLLHVQLPFIWWVALPVSIWVLYTADHLLDAYRLKHKAHTDRHLFHHRHFTPLLGVWGGLLLSCLSWIAWLVPFSMLIMGLTLGGISLLHFGLIQWVGNRVSRFLMKELGVALVYAAGVWGGPLSLAWPQLSPVSLLCFGQFFTLALINLLVFSMYELQVDEQDGHTSFVRAIGEVNAQRVVLGLALMMTGLGAWTLLEAEKPEGVLVAVQVIYALMLLVLLALAIWPERFYPQERYRLLGDGAFLLPGLIFFV